MWRPHTPDEVTNHGRHAPHLRPHGERCLRKALRAHEGAVGQTLVILVIDAGAGIVVPGNVESVQEGRVLLMDERIGGGDGAPRGGIERLDQRLHLLRQCHARRREAHWDLVANRPHDNGRVVAVAQHERFQVTLPPGIKVGVVIVGILAVSPAVEGLVHHEHTMRIARVEKGGRDGVVARTDGIVAGSLEHEDLALLCARDGHRTERPVVVVHAAAVQLQALPIEHKSSRRVERERAHSKAHREGVVCCR